MKSLIFIAIQPSQLIFSIGPNQFVCHGGSSRETLKFRIDFFNWHWHFNWHLGTVHQDEPVIYSYLIWHSHNPIRYEHVKKKKETYSRCRTKKYLLKFVGLFGSAISGICYHSLLVLFSFQINLLSWLLFYDVKKTNQNYACLQSLHFVSVCGNDFLGWNVNMYWIKILFFIMIIVNVWPLPVNTQIQFNRQWKPCGHTSHCVCMYF